MTPGQRSSATVKKPVYDLSFAEGVRHQLERLPGHLYQRAKRIIEGLKIDPRPQAAPRRHTVAPNGTKSSWERTALSTV